MLLTERLACLVKQKVRPSPALPVFELKCLRAKSLASRLRLGRWGGLGPWVFALPKKKQEGEDCKIAWCIRYVLDCCKSGCTVPSFSGCREGALCIWCPRLALRQEMALQSLAHW